MDRAIRKHGGRAKANQYGRAKKVLWSIKSMAGRVFRDVERKISDASFAAHKGTLLLAEQVLPQKRHTKGKVYSVHAPEVECIAKGKSHKPYEFGVKVSLAVIHTESFVVGIQAFPGNPFDGQTLDAQLDQVERLTGKVPSMAYGDWGYKGHGVEPSNAGCPSAAPGSSARSPSATCADWLQWSPCSTTGKQRASRTKLPQRPSWRRHKCAAVRGRPQPEKDPGQAEVRPEPVASCLPPTHPRGTPGLAQGPSGGPRPSGRRRAPREISAPRICGRGFQGRLPSLDEMEEQWFRG